LLHLVIYKLFFSVNPVDSTRMDLVIPGEQHIYLRAATSQERQQWLVALGSAKACVMTRNRKDSGDIAPPTLNSKCWKHSEYSDIWTYGVLAKKKKSLIAVIFFGEFCCNKPRHRRVAYISFNVLKDRPKIFLFYE